MRKGAIDLLAILGIILTYIGGALTERHTDGAVTAIIYMDTNATQEKKYPKIITEP